MNDFEKEIRRLESECNSMECPDCGGLHQVRFKVLPDGSVSEPVFSKGLSGNPCFGYVRFVIDSLNSLTSRYSRGERP